MHANGDGTNNRGYSESRVENRAEMVVVDSQAVANGLISLMDVQAVVSSTIPGALNGSRETIVQYAYALTEEIHETVREIGWKPWKKQESSNVDRVIEEYSDILAFLGVLTHNLAEACGMTDEEFAREVGERYKFVSERNLKRFENGQESK